MDHPLVRSTTHLLSTMHGHVLGNDSLYVPEQDESSTSPRSAFALIYLSPRPGQYRLHDIVRAEETGISGLTISASCVYHAQRTCPFHPRRVKTVRESGPKKQTLQDKQPPAATCTSPTRVRLGY